MNYGPLEFADYLRKSDERESAAVSRGARGATPGESAVEPAACHLRARDAARGGAGGATRGGSRVRSGGDESTQRSA